MPAPGAAASEGLAAAGLNGPSGERIGEIVWEPWHPGRTQLAWLIPALLGSLLIFTLFTQIVLRSIRRATAVVRQSEARFRDIAEAASDWIWETDRGLMLTYVSEQFGGATGLSPADVLGRPLHRILQLCDQIPPDAAARRSAPRRAHSATSSACSSPTAARTPAP